MAQWPLAKQSQVCASAEATPEHSLAHINIAVVVEIEVQVEVEVEAEVVVIAISMPLWRQAGFSSDDGSPHNGGADTGVDHDNNLYNIISEY